MNKNNASFFLKVIDHSVSKETFDLLYSKEYDMLITDPQPEDLHRYYESDDYISHTDSKRSLFEMAYYYVKKIALQNKLNLLNNNQAKGTLLDIGAGTGDFLTICKNNGWKTIGIEPSQKAKNIALKKDVTFVDSIDQIESNSIDAVTLWHVLEHIPDLNNQIQQLYRVLKPNGTLIIAVPNFKSFDAKHYGSFWAAFDVPIHLWHFSKNTIQKLFTEYHFILKQVKPMLFDSFYVSLLSEKYKTGSMNYIKAIWIGLKSNWAARKTKEASSHIYILKKD